MFSVIFHLGYCLSQSPHLFQSKFCRGNHMSVAEWIDTYGIQSLILWSSYRKLAWVGFEPKSTEFCSDALTNWAIRPWVQHAFRANSVQLLQSHHLFSVIFYFSYCLRQSPHVFQSKFCRGNHMSVVEWVDTYGIHHWRILWSSYRICIYIYIWTRNQCVYVLGG